MKLKLIYFLPLVVWFTIANILFLMPGNDVPHISVLDKLYFDKWVHCGLCCGLTFLTAYPFIQSGRCTKKMLIKISIAFTIYGILIEFMQKYFAYQRDFDVKDMVADAIGCLIGFILANKLMQHKTQKNKPL